MIDVHTGEHGLADVLDARIAATAEPDMGALLQRFEVDPASERALSRLRLVAAVLAGLGAIAMLLSTLPFTILLTAVLALLVSAGWMATSRRLKQRARTPDEHILAIHTRGLFLREGASQTWVPWNCVTHIDVDEERLEIVLERADRTPLRLEPRYSGVEIHTLMQNLRDVWCAANDE